MNHEIAMRNLDNQLGRLAQTLNSYETEMLPSNAKNPDNRNDNR